MKRLRQNILLAVVFFTGACVLIIEVTAVRILSPFFGSTIYTVSSVLTIILAALSVGYYYGGRMADRDPSPRKFYGLILLGGLSVLLMEGLIQFILPLLGYGLSLRFGPFYSSLLLFFLPGLLLGLLSPYAIKLQEVRNPNAGIGTIAGEIFFWSTFGSISGSLAAGFLLIPHLGLSTINLSTGIALCLVGITGYVRNAASMLKVAQATGVLVLVLAFDLYVPSIYDQSSIAYARDGIYTRIIVQDTKKFERPVRYLRLNLGYHSGIYLDSEKDLPFEYYQSCELFRLIGADRSKKLLVLGGGAYIMPRLLLDKLPDATVDVVDIEPSLYDVAQKYFGLQSSPRLINHIADARRFLQDTDTAYDVIYNDASNALLAAPPHLLSVEYFSLLKSRLSGHGMLIANVLGGMSRQKPSLVYAMLRTMQHVFPNNLVLFLDSSAVLMPQNFVFVGFADDSMQMDYRQFRSSPDSLLSTLSEHTLFVDQFVTDEDPLLTDNYTPSDYLVTPLFGFALNPTVDRFNPKELAALRSKVRSLTNDQRESFVRNELSMFAGSLVVSNGASQAEHSQVNGQHLLLRGSKDNVRIQLASELATPGVTGADTLSTAIEVLRAAVALNTPLMKSPAERVQAKQNNDRTFLASFYKSPIDALQKSDGAFCKFWLANACGSPQLTVDSSKKNPDCDIVLQTAQEKGIPIQSKSPQTEEMLRSFDIVLGANAPTDATCPPEASAWIGQLVSTLLTPPLAATAGSESTELKNVH